MGRAAICREIGGQKSKVSSGSGVLFFWSKRDLKEFFCVAFVTFLLGFLLSEFYEFRIDKKLRLKFATYYRARCAAICQQN
jgi:hypothetical protein